MEINRVYVVTLWAQDVPAAAHFYSDVLGLTLLPQHGKRPHFQVGETLITILPASKPITQEGQSMRFPAIAFQVPDLDAAVGELQAASVPLPWGVGQDAEGRWVICHDPAGNLIELAEPRR
ncbi:MAG: VOC family protein [Anaerolineales bacterium]